ncbi:MULTISPECIES: LLM class flavin-dependent oxidoreductase [unclassified Pseudoclavibacter]|uniref:LLM class flavin-dependent oxidoreductase n=1 Tax=unclassified Pseudoclavibacter TaxID=2615177 RepID=UPI0013010505|nr:MULTISPECIES: LLM class flavin-dependent oxidoreductase [unclassified Pseudoclavibacter]KAB1644455.1 LLM class flavin-dependent oxidoreductase [Pseudoclavibacter sp. CFCC 14310]KAB1664041.1 LLM class flavin-dependent oxidoreductase [Pseudoclavibacter sp. CFCC 13611]
MTDNLPLRRLGFLTIGLFDEKNPRGGHETTLEVIERGERLGYDSAWLRQRHLQYGISSPVAVMAAATQRTSRIELGTAVIPLGAENPLRLAEDLATVDVLSGGRVNPGVSVGRPFHYDDWKHALYPDTFDDEDFTYRRVERLIEAVRGDRVSEFSGADGIVEEYSDHVQPHAAGLVDRLWYGAGSERSVRWAAEHGLNLLTSSVISGELGDNFDENQRHQIEVYRENYQGTGAPRVSQGLVVIPTDNATSDQVRKYEEYVERRLPRTTSGHGPKNTLFSRDLVGTSAQIAERLDELQAFRLVDEVAFALPFSFEQADYDQLIEDIAGELGPRLGWQPRV